MLSLFASRTRWRSHKPAKPRIRSTTHRRHFTEVKPPLRPEYAEAVYAHRIAEREANETPLPSIPDILQEIQDLLPMSSNHLAMESVRSIRGKLSGLIRIRKWRADKLKATHPAEAEDIQKEIIRIETARELLHALMISLLFPNYFQDGYSGNSYDALIGDITEKTLFTSLSDQLGVQYLSPVDPTVPPTWPVKGVVFGPNKRVFVNLILSNNKHSLNVFFLVNTTCPNTLVSPAVMAALDQVRVSWIKCRLHGEELSIFKSPQTSHFADLNVLGRDFFLGQNRMNLLVDYPAQTCTLFKESETEEPS